MYMYMQWLTTCVKQCQSVIMPDKEIMCFCLLESSETQALRSRPSEDNLQWARVNLLSAYSEEKKNPNALAGGNSFIYCLITTLFQNCTETLTESFILWLRCIMFLINYLLITDRLIRDKDRRCLIPFGNFQYAPRAAIFVDLFGGKLAPASAASATVYRLCR